MKRVAFRGLSYLKRAFVANYFNRANTDWAD